MLFLGEWSIICLVIFWLKILISGYWIIFLSFFSEFLSFEFSFYLKGEVRFISTYFLVEYEKNVEFFEKFDFLTDENLLFTIFGPSPINFNLKTIFSLFNNYLFSTIDIIDPAFFL